MQNNKYAVLLLGILSLSYSAMAQKRQVKSKAKAVQTEAAAPSILMEDVLPATAKLVFVDSVVCSKDEFMSHIPLTRDCGRFVPHDEFFGKTGKAHNGSYVYENEFGDRCFYIDSTANAGKKMFTAEKLGGKWQTTRMVDELGNDFTDINYPYLMPDGVTLYFSAVNKNNSLGGHDIFMTRLDSESMRFYKPENIGLPYNSSANDYCCIIDDMNSLGWLVTDRFQPKGKVCVYTFIPSSERWTDGHSNISGKKLEVLAKITSIKDTWTDKKIVDDAKNRLKGLESQIPDGSSQNRDFMFVVNDNTVYKDISSFKSPTGRQMYSKLAEMKSSLQTDKRTLDLLRRQYSTAKGRDRKTISENIMILEKGTAKETDAIRDLEKKIRNAENLKK